MFSMRTCLLGSSGLALLLNSNLLLADPGNGKGHQGNGHSDKSNNSQNVKNANRNSHADDDFQQHYNNDVEQILRIFSENSGHYGQINTLPLGIRKNLARGKPLPPGIAKKINPDVARQLPHYQGYEWRQVGSDAALVNITTGIVRELMRDVLR